MWRWLKKKNSRSARDGIFFAQIKQITGHKPKKGDIYRLALTHSSALEGNKKPGNNNERLEFLGDAILGAVVADFLYREFPGKEEGFLTRMRSKIVSRQHLNQLACQLQLDKLVIKQTSRADSAKSIYGNALEALVGALYLEGGTKASQHFIESKILRGQINLKQLAQLTASYKSKLLEWAQKNHVKLSFEVLNCEGQNHAPRYEVAAVYDGETAGKGTGRSKKKAEEEAAIEACKWLNLGHGKTEAGN